MNYNSEDHALTIGHIFVTIPVYLIMMSLLTSIFWHPDLKGMFSEENINFKLAQLLPILAIPFAWLYWSVAIPNWKLWAYSKVSDVSLLKYMAIEQNLIWPDNHIFEKTEICSQETRRKILKLEKRL